MTADETETPPPDRLEAHQGWSRFWRWVGGAVCLMLVVVGAWLTLRHDNLSDFNDLRRFTSADHQADRCATQEAFDAQEKIRRHFETEGGLSDEDASLMAPLVGLEPDEMKALVGAELFPMNYDCDVPVASSQEATTGLLLVALGAGGAFSAVIAGVRRRTRR